MNHIQTRALAAIPEIRRTIADRRQIVSTRPETASALEPRIETLGALLEFLDDLTHVTYVEGDKPKPSKSS